MNQRKKQMSLRKAQEDVCKFHEKFGLLIQDIPTLIDDCNRRLRGNLIAEESTETCYGIVREDMVEIADGIGDAIFVLLGAAVSYGIDMSPIWDRITEANMAKEGGSTREDGKILKSADWKPPDIRGELIKQGWKETNRDS